MILITDVMRSPLKSLRNSMKNLILTVACLTLSSTAFGSIRSETVFNQKQLNGRSIRHISAHITVNHSSQIEISLRIKTAKYGGMSSGYCRTRRGSSYCTTSISKQLRSLKLKNNLIYFNKRVCATVNKPNIFGLRTISMTSHCKIIVSRENRAFRVSIIN
jgi:hypothetical protein